LERKHDLEGLESRNKGRKVRVNERERELEF
jgi:hypothetical protein